jgi:hypothetical protein
MRIVPLYCYIEKQFNYLQTKKFKIKKSGTKDTFYIEMMPEQSALAIALTHRDWDFIVIGIL